MQIVAIGGCNARCTAKSVMRSAGRATPAVNNQCRAEPDLHLLHGNRRAGNQGDNMRAGICSVAVLMGATGIVADVAAANANHSG